MAKLSARISVLISLIFLVSCDHATKGVAKVGLEGGSAHELIRGVVDFRYVENTTSPSTSSAGSPKPSEPPDSFSLGPSRC